MVCDDVWQYEKERFKDVKGYEPEPEDFAEWIFNETKFSNQLIKRE